MAAMELSSLFSYYIYRNIPQSLLLRKKGNAMFFADNSGAMVQWGPSIFLDGEFTEANCEQYLSLLNTPGSPKYLYYPNDAWRGLIQDTYGDRLKDIYLRVYQSDAGNLPECGEIPECIVPVTREFIEKNLPGTELVTDELYSYTDMEDFYETGYGLALVMDGKVCGFCLSEYSVDNSCGINIWVDEPYRQQGYARKMTDAFLAYCKETNQTAYWVCDHDNIPSNKLAVSAGFVLKSTMHYFEL